MNLYVIAIALAVIAGITGWASWESYQHGKAVVKGEWDAQTVKDQLAAKAERDRIAKDGFSRATELESELADLRKKHQNARFERSRALAAQVTCPASGSLGDLVLPVAAVRSMLDPSGSAAPIPAGSASAPSQSASAVR